MARSIYRNGAGTVSRRLLLAAAVAASHRAAAQSPAPKISRAQAAYQDKPQGGLSCQSCTFFRKPHACQVVEGEISPDGWCRLFDMPD
jgi:hypothetical protein